MADHFLILIPTDPDYIPPPEYAQAAHQYLRSILPAEDILSRTSQSILFVDQGQNFQHVICPACGTELAISDWQQMMDMAYKMGFANLIVTMPCCAASASLNDLRYEWPAGFARFSIEVVNPDADLDDRQIHRVEDLLGSPIRQIWRRL